MSHKGKETITVSQRRGSILASITYCVWPDGCPGHLPKAHL